MCEAYRQHAGRRTFSRSSLKSAEGVSGTGASVFGGREDAADAAPLDEDAPDAVSEGRGAPQGSSCPEGAAVTAGSKSPEAREIQPREAAVASGDLQFS